MEITYQEYENRKKAAAKKDGSREFKVGYLNSLKNDGDETIVRFDYDTLADIKVHGVHEVEVEEGKPKQIISCLRASGLDPIDDCPLCAGGNKIKNKVFLKVLDYTKDANGNVTPSAKVFARPAGFIEEIKEKMAGAVEVGVILPTTKIRDIVFKLRRKGTGFDTTYVLTVCNKAVYRDDIYTADFSAFADLDLSHHSYKIKTAEDIKTFLETGEFPKPVKAETAESAETAAQAPAVHTDPVVSAGERQPVNNTEDAPASRPQRVGF